jgi:hypothetical protein
MLDDGERLGILLAALGAMLGLVALGAGALAGLRVAARARERARRLEADAALVAAELVRAALAAWKESRPR